MGTVGIAGYSSGLVNIWDTETKTLTGKINFDPAYISDKVSSLSSTDDGQLVVYAVGQETFVWDTRLATEVRILKSDSQVSKTKITRNDGNSVVIGNDEGKLLIWDLRSTISHGVDS